MTNKKRNKESDSDFEQSFSLPKKEAPRARPVPQVKRISFHQYAVLKELPERHRPGLKAFVKYPQKKRSIEEWDACFKNY